MSEQRAVDRRTHGRNTEGSPLLGAPAPDPMREWQDMERTGSERALLGESRGRSRRGSSRNRDTFLRRNWRASAGAAGVLMFAMALAGVVAIFSTIQRGRAPAGGALGVQEMKEVDVGTTTAAAAPAVKQIPETCEKMTLGIQRSIGL